MVIPICKSNLAAGKVIYGHGSHYLLSPWDYEQYASVGNRTADAKVLATARITIETDAK